MHCVLSRSYVVFVFLFEGSHYLRKKFFCFFLFFTTRTQFSDMLLRDPKPFNYTPEGEDILPKQFSPQRDFLFLACRIFFHGVENLFLYLNHLLVERVKNY